MATIVPKKLAIYYGWPSAVNGSGGDVNAAANVFKDYDLVVFGAGLEDPGHGDHANTASIIVHSAMASTEVYGYIDATLSVNDIQGKIDQWHAMGVAGIFLDQFGYDFGVSRDKQRSLVWCIHEKGAGLKAFVNAWNPDDAFSPAVEATYNPAGLATRLDASDWYLAESYAIKNGAYDDEDVDTSGKLDWIEKAEKMVAHKGTFGTNMAAITTNDESAFDQARADYSYYAAVQYEFDAWGWGEENFSSVSATLPLRARKEVYGTKHTGPVVPNGAVYERQTNVGIHIDTVAHTVSHLLD